MGLFDAFSTLGRRAGDSLGGGEGGLSEQEAAEAAFNRKLDAIEAQTVDLAQKQLGETLEALSDAEAEMFMRETILEDMNWRLPDGSFENLTEKILGRDKHGTRKMKNIRAEQAWEEDPVVGRAVNTINEYVWGRGLPMPRATDRRVQRLIKSFWMDPDNRLMLTTLEAQMNKGTELSLFGELFLVVFDQGMWQSFDDPTLTSDIEENPTAASSTANGNGSPQERLAKLFSPEASPLLPLTPTTGGTPGVSAAAPSQTAAPGMPGGANHSGGVDASTLIPGLKPSPEPPPPPSAVKIGQIHPNEIIDVIPDPDNQARPYLYKRAFTTRRYDFRANGGIGGWVEERDTKVKIKYYKALKFFTEEDNLTTLDMDPTTEVGEVPEYMLGEGQIFHIAINRTSFSLRGNSEVWRAVRWAKALNDFFQWRLTTLRALSTYLFRKKVKAGPTGVSQAAQRFPAGTGRTGIPAHFDPVAPPAPGSLLVENQNETLEQFKTTSGAGEAEQDSQMLRGQAGAALGLPIHYLGDKGSANLANATAMEVPVLKMMETRQEIFEQLISNILNYAIDKAIDDGALPKDIDRTFYVEMPHIMQRSIPELVASLTNTTARLDPFAQDIKLKRFSLQQVLSWLGYPDPDAMVRHIYPPELEAQLEAQQQAAMAAQAQGAPEQGATPPTPMAPGPNPVDASLGAFAGAQPESTTPPQAFPGANTGVTTNNGTGVPSAL